MIQAIRREKQFVCALTGTAMSPCAFTFIESTHLNANPRTTTPTGLTTQYCGAGLAQPTAAAYAFRRTEPQSRS